ncbi:MAG: hypothetical protein ACYC6B_09950 [Thermoleophilia bacterium]
MRLYRTATLVIVCIAAAGLLLFLAVYIQGRSFNEKESSDSDWESLPVISYPDEGEAVLAECARTACVASKAAELAAQAEAERQAKLAAEAEAASQTAPATVQSCDEMLAEWTAMYGSLPSYQRPPMPCGPYAGYSSSWTAGQAQWEAMSEEEKKAFAREHGGTYGQ